MSETNIPNLKIESNDDGLITLEQDWCGNVDRVAIHPLHLRYMAETFGLVTTSDPQATKTIGALTRRLLVLRERIDRLDDYLLNCSDHAHANLDWEVTFSRATCDIAAEFCAELADTDTPPAVEYLKPVLHSESLRAQSNTDADPRQMAIDV